MTAETESTARVVIVDDSRLILEIARDALADRVQVECCGSGEAALEALERQPADLVISDLNMPGISGVELLERVRQEHPGTDFVLLTAHASVESAVRALRMGAADYLIKPVQPEALALVVERILGQRRLLEENVKLRDALTTLESCRTLMRCLDSGELYAVALDLLLRSVGRPRGLVLFHRGSAPMGDAIAFRGFEEADAGRLRDVLVGDKAVDLDGILEMGIVGESPLHDIFRALGIEPELAVVVPLRGREAETGVFWIFDDGRPFGTGDIERVKMIASHAQVALLNAERYNHAKERAFIDDVTEVYNARYLIQAAEREIHRAERYQKKLTVLFLDLDRFKQVNDEYGHLVGSRVLRQLSEVLATCIRQVDTLARYGGDEFTILLVDTEHETGLTIAERIRSIVSDTRFEGSTGAPIHLEISIGAATYPDHGQSRDSLLDSADKAMYRSKSRGRNCVSSAGALAD
jgi:diguanylate cyclase (GGDEF)-like protein